MSDRRHLSAETQQHLTRSWWGNKHWSYCKSYSDNDNLCTSYDVISHHFIPVIKKTTNETQFLEFEPFHLIIYRAHSSLWSKRFITPSALPLIGSLLFVKTQDNPWCFSIPEVFLRWITETCPAHCSKLLLWPRVMYFISNSNTHSCVTYRVDLLT